MPTKRIAKSRLDPWDRHHGGNQQFNVSNLWQAIDGQVLTGSRSGGWNRGCDLTIGALQRARRMLELVAEVFRSGRCYELNPKAWANTPCARKTPVETP